MTTKILLVLVLGAVCGLAAPGGAVRASVVAGGTGAAGDPAYYLESDGASPVSESLMDGTADAFADSSYDNLVGVKFTGNGRYGNGDGSERISLYINNSGTVGIANLKGLTGQDLDNHGDITLAMTANRIFMVRGIEADHVAVNKGDMNVAARSMDSSASTISVYARGIDSDVGVNHGTIAAFAEGGSTSSGYWALADARGIVGTVESNHGDIGTRAVGGILANANHRDIIARADAVGLGSRTGENTGRLTSYAKGGNATVAGRTDSRADVLAVAYGSRKEIGNNDGDIEATAIGGIVSEADATAPTTIEMVEASGLAYGIRGASTGDFFGTNCGSIRVNAQGGTVSKKAVTAQAFGQSVGLFEDMENNRGDITASAAGGTISDASASTNASVHATSYGIYSDIENNDGDIRALARGGSISAVTMATTTARASGTAAALRGDVAHNNGAIEVVAIGGTVSAIDDAAAIAAYARAYGIIKNENSKALTNTGTISVEAVAGRISTDGGSHFVSDDADAYGIYFSDTNSLASSGLISARAELAEGLGGGTARAYQVYSAADLKITAYAMTFNSQQQVTSDYEGAIFVSGDKNNVFDNAKLYAFTDNHFNQVERFDIPSLVEGANISDQFSSADLACTSPDYTLRLIDGGGAQLQQLAIDYTPKASTPLIATDISRKITSSHTGIVRGNLVVPMLETMRKDNPVSVSYEGVRLVSNNPVVDARSMTNMAPGQGGWAFVMPYYTDLDDDSSIGYDADISGVTGGYNRWLGPRTVVGAHLGYGRADIDYRGAGYGQKNEDIEAGLIGLQGLHRFRDNWLLEGIATLFHTSNDYTDSNPLNRESGDYDTRGLDMEIGLSYVLNIDGNHAVLPSIGLRYFWQRGDSFTARNPDNADIRYGDLDEDQLYGHLGVDWYGHFLTKNGWSTTPSLGIGLEQALTDNEFGNTMTAGTVTRTVRRDLDETALRANAAIEFGRDVISVGLGYEGSYSDDTEDNSFYLELKYAF